MIDGGWRLNRTLGGGDCNRWTRVKGVAAKRGRVRDGGRRHRQWGGVDRHHLTCSASVHLPVLQWRRWKGGVLPRLIPAV